ncbi:hypothetical protein [Alcaligenes sp. WGS1538]|uniref:hypothetical protein n=1 Tax=Alcaligenes sp. WGS1538 TaxID=3366811 RepID=UPI00372D36CE
MMRSTTAFDDQFILHPDDELQTQASMPMVRAQPSDEHQRAGKASMECKANNSKRQY